RAGRRVRPPGEAPEGFGALVPDNVAQLHPLDAGLALELESRLPSWILVISDRCAMANGVEARVPFLDHRLIELTCQLPPALKMRCFKEKAVLRAAMRGALPESIRRRRKRPFMTPIREGFFAPDAPDYVRALLEPRRLEEAGLFEPAVVQRLLSELASAPAGHFRTHQLEFVLMLVLGTQLFHELFVANFRVEGPGI
ncbi:MAG: asparagine synthase, partial [Gemmatimonadales bacterium]|nr:asparagine synthase [Gemmatimonadales bacterium]